MSQKSTPKTNQQNTNNLLVFALAALVGVVLTGNFLFKQGAVTKSKDVLGAQEKKLEPQIEKNAPHLELSAKSYFALDTETGKVLLAKNENEPLLPASTTKMATALVAMSYYKPEDVITVGPVKVEGHKMNLVPGEQITAQNLFYGLLVFSANDAAEALAANYRGGRANFVDAMNQQIKSLGLNHTHFTNPVGFDEYLHFSSSRDLVELAKYSMQNPLFSKIVATKNFEVSSTDGKIVHRIENTNELMDKMPGVLGVKTGWTENSGQDLVTLYEHDGHRIMLSVLGSSDRFGETEKILNWIFDNYEWK